MGIVKRNGDGKLKPDWSVIITLVLFLIGGGVSSLGAYYAIKYDLQQQDYRLKAVESRTTELSASVASIQLKDATDSEAFKNACTTLNELKQLLRDRRLRREQ